MTGPLAERVYADGRWASVWPLLMGRARLVVSARYGAGTWEDGY